MTRQQAGRKGRLRTLERWRREELAIEREIKLRDRAIAVRRESETDFPAEPQSPFTRLMGAGNVKRHRYPIPRCGD